MILNQWDCSFKSLERKFKNEFYYERNASIISVSMDKEEVGLTFENYNCFSWSGK